jgi:hypothetical protein
VIALLCNQSYFPDRYEFFCLFFKNVRQEVSETGKKAFKSMCRRLYRIFAHAAFHHRELFDIYEVCLIVY